MRAPLAIVFIALTGVLMGLLTLAVLDAMRTGTVPIPTITLVLATVACLLVLVGVAVAKNQPSLSRPYCVHCGARVYETVRSLDRRRLMTCFVCGAEWSPPATETQEGSPPRPPQPIVVSH